MLWDVVVPGPHERHYANEFWISVLAVFGLLVYLIAKYAISVAAPNAQWILFAVLIIGGAPLIADLMKRALAGEFGSDLLAGISIITSAIIGEYLAGCIIVLMLSGGTALEQYVTRRASVALNALAKRMPSIAHRRIGTEITDIGLDELHIDDVIVLFPHEICPVDGIVIEGSGTMDESYLTGEPYVISKTVGAAVLSGAVNGDDGLTISATALPQDSRFMRIMQVMREAEMNRPRFRRVADRLGALVHDIGYQRSAMRVGCG
jgi:cation transport ATPase